jgi:hypothetical protein
MGEMEGEIWREGSVSVSEENMETGGNKYVDCPR